VSQATVALFLHDLQAEERLTRRAELTAREYQALGVAGELVAARGDSALARLFSLVQLGDYVSCYLALLYGVDPTPVDAIQAFKAGLARDGG
jgi:glucose/mannose-6-phosphate isomerase